MAVDVVPIIVDNAAPAYVQHFAMDVNDALVRLAVIDEDITSALSNIVTASYTADSVLTATIDADDSIPQNTEGTQILSVTITPSSTTSEILLRGHGWGGVSLAVDVVWALFSSQSANAIQAGFFFPNSVTGIIGFAFEAKHAPATGAAVTYSLRVGPASAANLRLNGSSAARYFGGSAAASLVAQEVPL